jgi:hypothetical protein
LSLAQSTYTSPLCCVHQFATVLLNRRNAKRQCQAATYICVSRDSCPVQFPFLCASFGWSCLQVGRRTVFLRQQHIGSVVLLVQHLLVANPRRRSPETWLARVRKQAPVWLCVSATGWKSTHAMYLHGSMTCRWLESGEGPEAAH